ncbi:hypothetical protein AB0454_43845 [Streptomyces sp. NPDC093509]|uniref:hypothetical protein n=1 Tax=Streptomyces sp. NPDC093509 TaxID=3154982 RepID=UPI00344B4780
MTVEQVAADTGVHAMTLWKGNAPRGHRRRDKARNAQPGRNSAKRVSIKLLEQETGVLRQAAAYLTQVNLPGKGSTSF